MIIVIRPKPIVAVAIVMMLSNIAEIHAGSSRGFRGDVGETMHKSRHKIAHTIQIISPVSSPV